MPNPPVPEDVKRVQDAAYEFGAHSHDWPGRPLFIGLVTALVQQVREPLERELNAVNGHWPEIVRSRTRIADLEASLTRAEERVKVLEMALRKALSRCLCEGLPWCDACKADLPLVRA